MPHSVDHALRAARTRHPKLPAGGLVAPEEHSRLVLDDGAETFGGDAAHDLPGRDGPHVKHAALGLVERSELGAREARGHEGWHAPIHQPPHHTGQIPKQRSTVRALECVGEVLRAQAHRAAGGAFGERQDCLLHMRLLHTPGGGQSSERERRQGVARVGVLGLQLLLTLLGRGSHGLALQRSPRTRSHPLTRSMHSAARAGLGTVVCWPLAARLLTRLEFAPELKRVTLPRVQLLR